MRIKEILAEARHSLSRIAAENAALESEILLCHALKVSRTHLIAWPEKVLEPPQIAAFQQLVEQRKKGVPVAYLTGYREFWSLKLQVTPATLIPRADSESLVERALQIVPADAEARIADLGTGSGAIALALAQERPRCQITATDNSVAALAVARENGASLQLGNAEFREGDWCQALDSRTLYDLIISNPPYIREDDPHLSQGDLPFEPTTALTSGASGLDDIRTIAAQAVQHLIPGGCLVLEHGADQGAEVRKILQDAGYQDIQTLPDLADRDRLTEGFTHL